VVLQQHQIYIWPPSESFHYLIEFPMGKPKFVIGPFMNPVVPSRNLTFCPLKIFIQRHFGFYFFSRRRSIATICLHVSKKSSINPERIEK
jgi:hypothetical protein